MTTTATECEATQDSLCELLLQSHRDHSNPLFAQHFIVMPSPYNDHRRQIVCRACRMPVSAHRSVPVVASAVEHSAPVGTLPAGTAVVDDRHTAGVAAGHEDEPVTLTLPERASLALTETVPSLVMALCLLGFTSIALASGFAHDTSSSGTEYWANIWKGCMRTTEHDPWACYPMARLGQPGAFFTIVQIAQSFIVAMSLLIVMLVTVDRGGVYGVQNTSAWPRWGLVRVGALIVLLLAGAMWPFIIMVSFVIPSGVGTFEFPDGHTISSYVLAAMQGGPSLYMLVAGGFVAFLMLLLPLLLPSPTRIQSAIRTRLVDAAAIMSSRTPESSTVLLRQSLLTNSLMQATVEGLPVPGSAPAAAPARLRGALVAMLALAACATTVVACTTPVSSNESLQYTQSMWYSCHPVQGNVTCAWNSDQNSPCASTANRFAAPQVFTVITGIAALVALLIGLVDHGHSILRRHQACKAAMIAPSALQIAASVTAWSLLINVTLTGDTCDAEQSTLSEHPGFSWGAAAFLLCVITLLGLAQLAVSLRISIAAYTFTASAVYAGASLRTPVASAIPSVQFVPSMSAESSI
jgi:hypothetical protein